MDVRDIFRDADSSESYFDLKLNDFPAQFNEATQENLKELVKKDLNFDVLTAGVQVD
jgi:hypothetical protein